MQGSNAAMPQGNGRTEEDRPRFVVLRTYTAGEHAEPSAIGFYHSLREAAERVAEEVLDSAGDCDADDLTSWARPFFVGEALDPNDESNLTGESFVYPPRDEVEEALALHVERHRSAEVAYSGTWHDPEGRSIAGWQVVDLDAPEGEAGEGMVDGADVVARIAEALPFPTHCASCGHLLKPSPEQGEGDTIDPAFPYCRTCYYGGRAYAHLHAATIGTLRAYGLRASWWNTGGGCWILAVVRDAAPEAWGEEAGADGSFVPFVAAGEAFDGSDGWTWESGGVDDPTAAWGATYFPTNDAWCGELGAESAEVAPVDAHGLARFALEHLPPVRPIVPPVSEALAGVADAIDLALYRHGDDLDGAMVHRMRELEADLRTASTDAYVAANPHVHPDAL